MKSAYEKNRRTYNLRSRSRNFDVGQIVPRRNFVQSNLLKHFNAKLAPTGIRSKVIEKVGNNNYILQDLNSKSKSMYHAKDIW